MIQVDLVFGPLAIAAIRALPKRLKSVEEASSLPGVGAKTAMKARVLVLVFFVAVLTAMFQIKEIVETGGLRRIAFENTEDIEVMKIFQGVYGVGAWPPTAIALHIQHSIPPSINSRPHESSPVVQCWLSHARGR